MRISNSYTHTWIYPFIPAYMFLYVLRDFSLNISIDILVIESNKMARIDFFHNLSFGSFCRHDNVSSTYWYSQQFSKQTIFLDKISILPIQYIKMILSSFFVMSLCGMKNQSISSHHPPFAISIHNAMFLYPRAQIYEKWKFSSSNFLLDKKSSFCWRSFSFAFLAAYHISCPLPFFPSNSFPTEVKLTLFLPCRGFCILKHFHLIFSNNDEHKCARNLFPCRESWTDVVC